MNILGKKQNNRRWHTSNNKGFKNISSNHECRYGQIDLIMQDTKTIVFVEVRMRKSQHFAVLH